MPKEQININEQPQEAENNQPVIDQKWLDLIKDNSAENEYIAKHAGSKPDMVILPMGKERFDETVIPVDEKAGINEEMIQIITLGSFLDHETLYRAVESEHVMNPEDYFFMNVMQNRTGPREDGFKMVMFLARENSGKALEEYKKGNRKQFDRYLNNFVKYIKAESLNHPVTLDREGQVFNSLYKLVLGASEMPEFKGKFPEDILNKFRENVEVMKLLNRAREAELAFAGNVPEPGSDRRKELLLDMLVAEVVGQAGGAFLDETIKKSLEDNRILINAKEKDLKSLMKPERLRKKYGYNFDDCKTDPSKSAEEQQKANIARTELEQKVAKEKENLEYALKEGMFSNKYYDEKVKPAVNLFLTDADIAEKGQNKDTMWSACLMEGIEMTETNVKSSAPTYQTDVINDPVKREKYYRRIRDMIAATTTFQNMLNEKDSFQIKLKLVDIKKNYKNLVTETGPEGAKKIIPFNVNDIPETEEEKKASEDRKTEEAGKTEQRIAEVEKTSFYFMNGNNYAIARSNELVADKALKKKIIEAVNQYADTNGIKLEKGTAYSHGIKDDFEFACGQMAKYGEPLYVKNEGEGLTKFMVDVDKAGNITGIKHKTVAAIEYKKADFVKEYYNNKHNAEIAEEKSLEGGREYCDSYRFIDSYMKVMEAAGASMEERPAEYDRVVDAMKGVSSALHGFYTIQEIVDASGKKSLKYPMAGDKLEAFEQAAEKFDACMKAYKRINPYDRVAIAMDKYLAADRKLIASVSKEDLKTKSLAEIILTAEKQKTEADPDKPIFIAKKFLDDKSNECKEIKLVDEYYEKLKSSIIDAFFYDRFEEQLARKKDGSFCEENGNYLLKNGEWFTFKQKMDFIKNNVRGLLEYLEKAPKLRKVKFEDELNKENIQGYLNSIGLKVTLPDDETESENLKDNLMIEEKLGAQILRIGCEEKIAVADLEANAEIPHEVSRFFDLSTTPEARESNKEMARIALNGTADEKKKLYEKLLDELDKLDPEDFKLANRNYLIDNAAYAAQFALKASEAKKVMEGAIEAGINLYDPKYDGLRAKAPVIHSMGFYLMKTFQMAGTPLGSVLKLEDMNGFPDDDVQMLADYEKGEVNPAFDGLDILAEYHAGMPDVEKGWKPDPKRSTEKVVAFGKKNLSIFEACDPTDKKLVELRRKLASNVRKTLGVKRKNSELYTNVIKAIDEYRLASSLDKEIRRRALEQACREYVENRGAEKERTKLIISVGKFVHNDLKPQAEKYAHDGHKKTAEQMMDTYIKVLEKSNSIEGKNALNSLTNEKFRAEITEKLINTSNCHELAWALKENLDKNEAEIFSSTSEAISELVREDSIYGAVKVKMDNKAGGGIKKNADILPHPEKLK